MKPTVLNLRTWTEVLDTDPNAVVVKVDRTTPWGNPFHTLKESERNWSCDMFQEYALWRLQKEPDWLSELRGKYLACWCAPKRCHADTLIVLANYPLEEAIRKLGGVCALLVNPQK